VHYSVVSFNAAEPYGRVTRKNEPVIASATERMLAVEHADAESVWLITQVAGGSEFHAFLFTREGLFAHPVISRSNQIATRSASTIGYLKASLDGTTLALTNLGDWQVEVFDFNPKSGEVRYRYDLSHEVLKVQPEQAIRTPYGVEFSPDGRRLYVTCSQTRELRQFDLKAGSAEAVARSQRVFQAQDFDGQLGAIQLSPEGRLFFTGFEDRLGRPTRVGVNQASYGLPIPFPRYLKQLNGDFSATRFCAGLPTQFDARANLKPESYRWDFGDPDSGDDHASAEASPSHTYQDSGSYEVRLTVLLGDQVEQITRTVHISQRPSLELGDNVPLVLGSSTILTAEVEAEQFQWMTGSTDKLLTALAPGLYTARAVRGSCVCGDSVRVLPVWQATASNDQSPDTDTPHATSSSLADGTNSSFIDGLRLRLVHAPRRDSHFGRRVVSTASHRPQFFCLWRP
jgi:PKD domain